MKMIKNISFLLTTAALLMAAPVLGSHVSPKSKKNAAYPTPQLSALAHIHEPETIIFFDGKAIVPTARVRYKSPNDTPQMVSPSAQTAAHNSPTTLQKQRSAAQIKFDADMLDYFNYLIELIQEGNITKLEEKLFNKPAKLTKFLNYRDPYGRTLINEAFKANKFEIVRRLAPQTATGAPALSPKVGCAAAPVPTTVHINLCNLPQQKSAAENALHEAQPVPTTMPSASLRTKPIAFPLEYREWLYSDPSYMPVNQSQFDSVKTNFERAKALYVQQLAQNNHTDEYDFSRVLESISVEDLYAQYDQYA